MKQILTAKVQVFADANQKALLLDSMRAFQAACNHISEHVYKTKDLSVSSLDRKLYYEVRAAFNLPSQMAQTAIRAVISAYRSMKSNGRWELAAFNKAFVEFVWNRDYLLRGDVFSINTLVGRVKLGYSNTGLSHYFDTSKYRFGQAKLLYRKGKFYLHIAVEHEIPDANTDVICNITGVDRGINFIANTYDSNGKSRFYSGRHVKNKKANYRRLRRELQTVNTRSARRRLKQVVGRENRWMSDVNHQISKALVETNPAGTLFAIEDLKGIKENVVRMTKSKQRHTEIVGWSYFDLEQKLKYKAEWVGSMVVKFNPAYTSQTCPKCGHVDRTNRDKRKHVFKCKCCGYQSNDDRVAAMNLHRLGLGWIAKDNHDAVDSE